MDMISSGVMYMRVLGFWKESLVGFSSRSTCIMTCRHFDCCLYPVMQVSQAGLGLNSGPVLFGIFLMK
jgi:hypothetical protein